MKKYIYDSSSLASFVKNIKAFATDFIILILLSLVVTFSSISICVNSTTYCDNNEIVNTQIEKMLDITKDAHLSDVDKNGELLTLNDMYKKYAIGHILLSYENNKEDFDENITENEAIKDYISINVNNDYLAYLYYIYLPNLEEQVVDYGDLSCEEYFKKILREVNADLSMFDMNKEYPTLNSSFALDLYNYIVLEQQIDNPSGLSANTLLADLFTKTFEYNSSIVQSIDFYQNEYHIYQEAYFILVKLMNDLYFYSYVFCFIVLFVIVPLFLGEYYSLGNFINGIIVCGNKKRKLSFYQLFLMSVFKFVLFLSSIFIVSFVIGGTNAITQSIFKIFNFNITMMTFVTISLILLIVNFLVSYIRQDKKTAVNLISTSMNLDVELLRVQHN